MDTQKLYAMLDPATGHVKIGRSVDPRKRVWEIERLGERKNLKILIVQECVSASTAEATLHEAFTEYRVEGEWFNLTPEILEQLESVYDAAQKIGHPSAIYSRRSAPNTEKTVTWKLPDFLEANGIKPYALWREIGTDINIKSIYNLTNAKKPPASVNFQTINLLLPALERLTGKQVSMADVMEYER